MQYFPVVSLINGIAFPVGEHGIDALISSHPCQEDEFPHMAKMHNYVFVMRFYHKHIDHRFYVREELRDVINPDILNQILPDCVEVVEGTFPDPIDGFATVSTTVQNSTGDIIKVIRHVNVPNVEKEIQLCKLGHELEFSMIDILHGMEQLSFEHKITEQNGFDFDA